MGKGFVNHGINAQIKNEIGVMLQAQKGRTHGCAPTVLEFLEQSIYEADVDPRQIGDSVYRFVVLAVKTYGAVKIQFFQCLKGCFPVNEALTHPDDASASVTGTTHEVFEGHHREVFLHNIQRHVNRLTADGDMACVSENTHIFRIKPFSQVHDAAGV